MRMDDLLLCHADADGVAPPQAYEDAAWAFVTAGGVLGLSEYRGLSTASRAAMRAAMARLWRERDITLVEIVTDALGEAQESALADVAQIRAERLLESVN